MNDKLLHQDVLDEFDFDPRFDAEHIGVVVEKGIVTLTGHVDNFNQKVNVVAAARRVKGVHAIADEIEVRYPSQAKTSDDQIAKRAMDILKWDVTLSNFEIDVIVRAGSVTLSGIVNWEFQRRAAADCVRKLSGVIGVFNNIKLRPQVSVADIKDKIEAALKRHAEVESRAIRVSVKSGNCVVLEGKVDTLAEQSAADGAAWSVAGVTAVEDHLVIG